MRTFPFGAAAFFLFLLSLILPAVDVDMPSLFGSGSRRDMLFGFQCLGLGIFVWPAWLANPFLFVGSIFAAFRARRPAVAMYVVATIFAILAPFFLVGMNSPVVHGVSVGYFVWLASIGCALAAAVRGMLPPHEGPGSPPADDGGV